MHAFRLAALAAAVSSFAAAAAAQGVAPANPYYPFSRNDMNVAYTTPGSTTYWFFLDPIDSAMSSTYKFEGIVKWATGQAYGTPVNSLFAASEYGEDCATSYVTSYSSSGSPVGHVCRVTKAPVVADGPGFIEMLKAGGYEYVVSYPQTNNGNGRALVTWMKRSLPSGTPADMGMARIENVGWTDQFGPRTVCINQNLTQATCAQVNKYKTYQYGDLYGDRTVPAAAAAGDNVKFARLFWWQTYHPLPGLGTAGSNAYVMDAWLSEMTPPPQPPVQVVTDPTAPAPPSASPVNVGGASVGAGGGVATPGSGDAVGGKAVDWDAYCRSATLSNGKPQSDFWIQGCLGQAH